MLTHQIIVHKPKVEYARPSTSGTGGVVPFNPYVRQGWAQPQVRTNEELREYLRRQPIAVDNFIISKNWALDIKLELYRVHYVLYVEDQLYRVPAFELSHPKCYYVAQLDSAGASKWIRWETASGYRALTPEEHQKIIEPNHDYVQNCIQEFRKQASYLWKEREARTAEPDNCGV
jgi:hypothetical protein